jgi:hypothetical protein
MTAREERPEWAHIPWHVVTGMDVLYIQSANGYVIANVNNSREGRIVADFIAWAACAPSLRDALVDIACFTDEGANRRLAERGSYSSFDEPGSVQIARAELAKMGVTS